MNHSRRRGDRENKRENQDQRHLRRVRMDAAHRCLTQGAQTEPPYARFTVFWRLERVASGRVSECGEREHGTTRPLCIVPARNRGRVQHGGQRVGRFGGR
jgi:hypothetical protein